MKDKVTKFSRKESELELSGSSTKDSSFSGDETSVSEKTRVKIRELPADGKRSITKGTEKSIEKDRIERLKGGEEGDRIYQQFTCTKLLEGAADLEVSSRRSLATQM